MTEGHRILPVARETQMINSLINTLFIS